MRQLGPRHGAVDDAGGLCVMRRPEPIARSRDLGRRVLAHEDLEEPSDGRRADESHAVEQQTLQVSPEGAGVGRRSQRSGALKQGLANQLRLRRPAPVHRGGMDTGPASHLGHLEIVVAAFREQFRGR